MRDPRPKDERSRIEWWSFDAVADDGTSVISIRFFSSHIFSSDKQPRPAVSFVYSKDGEPICRSVNEFGSAELLISSDGVSIAGNNFVHDSAGYGSGVIVTVSLPLPRGKQLEARFEWLELDGEGAAKPTLKEGGCGNWEIDSARSDVSGRVTVIGSDGRESVCHFRGTGSQSHYRSGSEDGPNFGVRLSGAAHFVDSTVFFCREGELLSDGTHANLSVVQDSLSTEALATSAEHYWTRTRYGIKYPRRFVLETDDAKLRIKLMTPYESELCLARFPAEVTLTLPDEKQRKAIGCVEVLEPGRLRSNLVRWFSGLGVGHDGKAPYL